MPACRVLQRATIAMTCTCNPFTSPCPYVKLHDAGAGVGEQPN
jgi:hypothetical protein